MESEKKVQIEYPCAWAFKVIGTDKQLVRDAAETIMGGREFLLHYSKSSRTGKYHSWTIDLVVADEEERNEMYRQLKSHADVIMVI